MIQLGFNANTGRPIRIDLRRVGHLAVIGNTGSGKTTAVLYILYGLLKSDYEIQLSIGDFKRSHDYVGITDRFAEYDSVPQLIEEFYMDFENTPEKNRIINILLVDELAGFLSWYDQRAPKEAARIREHLSSLLMLGRSRSYYIWTIQQRITAKMFSASSGAVDNYQICIGMGRLTVESRKTLYAGEHMEDTTFEAQYHPKAGQGLVLIDGQELQPLQIPDISDSQKLKKLLAKLAADRARREAPASGVNGKK